MQRILLLPLHTRMLCLSTFFLPYAQEYRGILDNAKRIQDEFKDRPRALAYICGIVTDLYVDWHKYNGRDLKHKIPELEQFLELQV